MMRTFFSIFRPLFITKDMTKYGKYISLAVIVLSFYILLRWYSYNLAFRVVKGE